MIDPVDLAFDDASHTYRYKGALVPGVTGVLEQAGLYDFGGASPEVLRVARERGRIVHKLTELDDLANLDWDSVDPALIGYLEAWRLFRKERRFMPSLIEARVYHSMYRYAGTLDTTGTLCINNGTHTGMIDKKTGARQKATGPQTAAYLCAAHDVCRLPMTPRYGCYLQEDGKYDLVYYDNRNDLSVFLAALTIKNFKEQRK